MERYLRSTQSRATNVTGPFLLLSLVLRFGIWLVWVWGGVGWGSGRFTMSSRQVVEIFRKAFLRTQITPLEICYLLLRPREGGQNP
jgi:hypothetical protein